MAVRAPFGAVHHDTAVGQWQVLGLKRRLRVSLGFDAAKFSEQNFIVGFVIDIVDVDISDESLLIDDEDGPFRVAFGPQNAVLLCHRAMGPEVAKERIVDPTKAFRPCLETGNMVYADAQNLGIRPRKLGVFGLVGRDLAASNGGPRQREKGQNHIMSPHMTQRDLFAQVAG